MINVGFADLTTRINNCFFVHMFRRDVGEFFKKRINPRKKLPKIIFIFSMYPMKYCKKNY